MSIPVSDSSEEGRDSLRAELQLRGVRDLRVLKAILSVPREKFVPDSLRNLAYRNRSLPIGLGQTISQPLVIAHMLEALQLHPTDRVLEIGTGSGYAAAILSQLCESIFTIERHLPLAQVAEKRLRTLGYQNVHVLHGDGTLGWPEKAPFDAIIVAACGPRIPQALLEQLQMKGRLVMPIGEIDGTQHLIRVTRESENRFVTEDLGEVRFVPLIGHSGWSDDLKE